MSRRLLLGIEEQVTPQLPVPIHHFPLDQANGLNDIVGSGVITPVSNRITWKGSENKYLFTLPFSNLAANITNLAWGVINNQPLNNLSLCFDIKIQSFLQPGVNWGIQLLTSGNIEMSVSQFSNEWYWQTNKPLRYINIYNNGNWKVYFNGILIYNGFRGNASGVLNNQLNVGGPSSSSGGDFYMWNLKIFNKVLTDNEIDVLNNN